MKADDITVTIRAIDKASPVLRRVKWMLWWYQYGGIVVGGLLGAVLVLVAVLAFILGRLTI